MRWDALERDLVVLSGELRKVSVSLVSLAHELRRERQNGSLSITRSDATATDTDVDSNSGGPKAQSNLFD